VGSRHKNSHEQSSGSGLFRFVWLEGIEPHDVACMYSICMYSVCPPKGLLPLMHSELLQTGPFVKTPCHASTYLTRKNLYAMTDINACSKRRNSASVNPSTQCISQMNISVFPATQLVSIHGETVDDTKQLQPLASDQRLAAVMLMKIRSMKWGYEWT
jgi:hypothetical protein